MFAKLLHLFGTFGGRLVQLMCSCVYVSMHEIQKGKIGSKRCFVAMLVLDSQGTFKKSFIDKIITCILYFSAIIIECQATTILGHNSFVWALPFTLPACISPPTIPLCFGQQIRPFSSKTNGSRVLFAFLSSWMCGKVHTVFDWRLPPSPASCAAPIPPLSLLLTHPESCDLK